MILIRDDDLLVNRKFAHSSKDLKRVLQNILANHDVLDRKHTVYILFQVIATILIIFLQGQS